MEPQVLPWPWHPLAHHARVGSVSLEGLCSSHVTLAWSVPGGRGLHNFSPIPGLFVCVCPPSLLRFIILDLRWAKALGSHTEKTARTLTSTPAVTSSLAKQNYFICRVSSGFVAVRQVWSKTSILVKLGKMDASGSGVSSGIPWNTFKKETAMEGMSGWTQGWRHLVAWRCQNRLLFIPA